MEQRIKRVPNPRGNPNIKDAPKPGATTKEGKLRLSCRKLITGNSSKWVKRMRKSCKECVLGERVEWRKINGKMVEVTIPRQCIHYAPNRKKCKMPLQEMVNKLRVYHDVMEHNTLDLQKALIMDSIADAQANREVETIKSGAPRFYTKEFNEQSLKYVTELNKIIYGQKQLNVNVDGTERASKELDAEFKVVESEKEDEEDDN